MSTNTRVYSEKNLDPSSKQTNNDFEHTVYGASYVASRKRQTNYTESDNAICDSLFKGCANALPHTQDILSPSHTPTQVESAVALVTKHSNYQLVGATLAEKIM